MEEKEITRSKLFNIKAITFAIFAVLAIIPNIILFSSRYKFNLRETADWKWTWDWVVENYGKNATPLTVTIHEFKGTFVLVLLAAAIIAVLFYLINHKMEIVVTDKRVYGKTSWGKRVDLPLDSISAVGTGLLKSIAVGTSSGRIHFYLIKNRDEVHEEISKLLSSRQKEKKSNPDTQTKIAVPQSNADELKKYKELLDSGIITQEEFDAKKKQLLGL